MTKKLLLQKGFTLVELLIVIALLGALAVGLIGALDPFEQLKKGTDTGTRDLVSQVQTAVIRFYSIKNNMPWCPSGAGCTSDPSSANLSSFNDAWNGQGSPLSNIINAGELKTDFNELNAGNLTKVFVTGSQSQASAIVCYRPASKSFRADPNTKYNVDGSAVANPETACEGNGGATQCYWCVQ